MSSDEILFPYVTLVSDDGFEFVMLREAACGSGTIARMLNPTSELIPRCFESASVYKYPSCHD